jgi:hypothetical protein
MGFVGIPPVRHTIGPRLGRVHLDDLWSSGDQALEGASPDSGRFTAAASPSARSSVPVITGPTIARFPIP